MNNQGKVDLGKVQETLLLPLWGRAVETKKPRPLLIDEKAVGVVENIAYDFSVIAKNVSKITQASWVARSIFFDNKIKAFIELYPAATVVNIGCGLDTTFDRVDNGTIQWIDLDLPDAIALRRRYNPETIRSQFVAASVFDTEWYARITNREHVLLLIAGVLYYFDEAGIKQLFHDIHTFIPGTEIIFDYSSKLGVKIANKKVIEGGGMHESACLKWSLENIYDIEKWDSYIRVITSMPMFREYKKNYPFHRRIGMNISDLLKVMSLAHIKIN